MQTPFQLLQSLTGINGFSREAFEKVHASGEQITSIRLNPAKISRHGSYQVQIPNSKINWAEFGYYLGNRPSFTFDPLFHAGCYYVQEASSMFLEQALKQTCDLAKPLKVLDLCAAPGGKSTHIQSLISPESLLVSNEVIRSRASILKDNMIKWGCENVMVTNNDPKDFAKLENYFDVIVVDAPCSGSGLFRREPGAIDEWSENNVQLCAQRQQRVLADVLPALKKEGILIYSTCSYSREEDEDIAHWLQEECSMLSFQLSAPGECGIIESDGGYRFWPDKVKGEGFFLACFKKKEGTDKPFLLKTKKKPAVLAKNETGTVIKWINPDDKTFIRNQDTVYAWPETLFNDFSFLLQELKVIYSGILVGELIRDKLIPGHPLAMSNCIKETVSRYELNAEQAIRFLQKKELLLDGTDKGWLLVTHQQHPLGWINVLHNRINNYYPMELRILKES